MGREIQCTIRWQGIAAEGKAILEGGELILRGEIRARIARGRIGQWAYEDGTLILRTNDGVLELDMPEKDGAAWMRALEKTPPSLAAKLGVSATARAFLIGQAEDEELAQALQGAQAARVEEAAILIAVLTDVADIAKAALAATQAGRPVWCLYPKGKSADPSDKTVRGEMRALGFIDVKSCAVSDRLTATKYQRRA